MADQQLSKDIAQAMWKAQPGQLLAVYSKGSGSPSAFLRAWGDSIYPSRIDERSALPSTEACGLWNTAMTSDLWRSTAEDHNLVTTIIGNRTPKSSKSAVRGFLFQVADLLLDEGLVSCDLPLSINLEQLRTQTQELRDLLKGDDTSILHGILFMMEEILDYASDHGDKVETERTAPARKFW